MDPELLLAMQEVDALTPAAPPIAPVYGPEEYPYGELELAMQMQNAALADRGIAFNSGMAAMSQQALNERFNSQMAGMQNSYRRPQVT